MLIVERIAWLMEPLCQILALPALFGDAFLHQRFLDGLRAAFAEAAVVFLRAAFVAVAFDDDTGSGMSFDEIRNGRDFRRFGGRNGVVVKREIDRIEISGIGDSASEALKVLLILRVEIAVFARGVGFGAGQVRGVSGSEVRISSGTGAVIVDVLAGAVGDKETAVCLFFVIGAGCEYGNAYGGGGQQEKFCGLHFGVVLLELLCSDVLHNTIYPLFRKIQRSFARFS